MSIHPRQVVEDLPYVSRPLGLFSVATVVNDASDHWRLGTRGEAMAPDPTLPPVINSGSLCFLEEDEETGLPKTLDGWTRVEWEADAFTLYAPQVCSPVGSTPEEREQHVTAYLAAAAETALEKYITDRFKPADESIGGLPSNPELLLASAEDVVRRIGGLGVIHVSAILGGYLAAHRLIEVQGTTARTRLGTPVVVGLGNAALGGGILVTGPIRIRQSPVFHPYNSPAELFDRARNDLYSIAEQTYTVETYPASYYFGEAPEPEPETGD